MDWLDQELFEGDDSLQTEFGAGLDWFDAEMGFDFSEPLPEQPAQPEETEQERLWREADIDPSLQGTAADAPEALTGFYRAIGRGIPNVSAGITEFAGNARGIPSRMMQRAGVNETVADILTGNIGPAGAIEKAVAAPIADMLRQAGSKQNPLMPAKPGAEVAWTADWWLENIGENAPNMALTMFGGPAGLAAMGAGAAGNKMHEANEQLKISHPDMPENERRARAEAVGIVSGISEVVLGRVTAAVGTRSVPPALKQKIGRQVASFLNTRVGAAAGAGVSEYTEEALQELVDSATDYVILENPEAFKDIGSRMHQAGSIGGVMGAGASAAGSAATAPREMQEASSLEGMSPEQLQEIVDTGASRKLSQLFPANEKLKSRPAREQLVEQAKSLLKGAQVESQAVEQAPVAPPQALPNQAIGEGGQAYQRGDAEVPAQEQAPQAPSGTVAPEAGEGITPAATPTGQPTEEAVVGPEEPVQPSGAGTEATRDAAAPTAPSGSGDTRGVPLTEEVITERTQVTPEQYEGFTQLAQAAGVDTSKFDVEAIEDAPEGALRQIEEGVANFMPEERAKYSGKDAKTEEVFFGGIWAEAMQKARKLLGTTRKSKGFKKSGDINQRGLENAVDQAMKDVDQYVQDNPRLLNYYHEEVEQERQLLEQRFGEMSDAEYDFYRLANGLASASTQLEGNTRESIDAWENFKKAGKFEVSLQRRLLKPQTRGGETEFVPAKPGDWAKGGAEFTIHGGAQVQGAEHYQSLNRLLKDFGGDMQAVNDYMKEETTWEEINAFREKYLERDKYSPSSKRQIMDNIRHAIGEEAAQDGKIPRIFAYGPKVGAYTLNRLGDDRYITVDVWDSRFWRSYFSDTPWDARSLGLETNDKIRELFIQAGHNMAKEMGVSPSAAQAIRWFYMIKKAKEGGYGKSTTDSSIAQYTERFLESDAAQERLRSQETAQRESALTEAAGDVVTAKKSAKGGRRRGFRKKGARKSDTGEQKTLFQREGDVDKAAIQRVGDRWKLYIGKETDVSSLIHELAHAIRAEVLEGNPADIPISAKQLKALTKWAGVKKDGVWSRAAEEKFARAFERYILDGRAPVARLQNVFKKLRDFMTAVYQTVVGTPLEAKVPDQIRSVFDSILKQGFTVPRPFIHQDGTVLLHHYSMSLPSGNPIIDPIAAAKHRKGYSRNEFSALEKPRTFFYLDNTQKEPMVNGQHYVARVDSREIYNLNKDPANLRQGQSLSDYVDTVEAAGYKGVYYKTGGMDIVSMLTPVPATQVKANQTGWVNSQADALLAIAKEKGGFTFDPRTGKLVTKGWAVAPDKTTEFKVKLDSATPDDIKRYAYRYTDRFDEKEVMLGGWVDGGYLWLDVSHVTDEETATKLGKAADQEAIFNLETFEEKRLKPAEDKDIDEAAPGPSYQGSFTTSKSLKFRSDTDPVSARGVIRRMSDRFGIPIKQDYMGQSKAYAFWHRNKELVRAWGTEVFQVAAMTHEIGHGIDQRYGITGMKGKAAAPQYVLAELAANDYQPELGRPQEGFAEFMRRALTTAEKTSQTMSATWHWFNNEFLPKYPVLEKNWKQTQKELKEYRDQGIYERLKAAFAYSDQNKEFAPNNRPVASLEMEKKHSKIKQYLKGIWDGMMRKRFDETYAIHQFVDKSKKNFIKELKSINPSLTKASAEEQWRDFVYKYLTADPHTMRMVLKYSAPSHAEKAVAEGVHSMRDRMRIMGPSIGKVLETAGVAENDAVGKEEFGFYAFAKAALERMDKQPNYVIGEATRQDYERYVEEMDAVHGDKFDEGAKEMTRYFNSLLDMVAEVGVHTRGEVRAMKKAWKYYIPMERVIEGKPRRVRSKSAGVGKLAKKLTKSGSSLPPADPWDAMTQRTVNAYIMAHDKMVENGLINLSKIVPGMSEIVKVDPDMKPSQAKLGQLLNKLLEDNVIDADWAQAIKDRQRIEEGEAGDEVMLRMAERIGHEIPTVTKKVKNKETGEMETRTYVGNMTDSDMKDFLKAIEKSGIPDATNTYTTFSKDFSNDPDNQVIRYIHPVTGEVELHQFDKPLYEALRPLPPEDLSDVSRFVYAWNRTFKTAAVGRNVTFTARNYMKDFANALVRPTHMGKVQPLHKAFGGIIKSTAITVSGQKRSHALEFLNMMGGNLYNRLGETMKTEQQRAGSKFMGAKKKSLGERIYSPVGWSATQLEKLTSISDIPPRLNAFLWTLQQHAEADGYEVDAWGNVWKPGTNKTERAYPSMWVLMEATMNSQEATTNFKARGSTARKGDLWVPFYGATFAGVRGMALATKKAHSSKTAAARFYTALGLMSFATVAIRAAIDGDDDARERYEEVLDWEKEAKWVIPLPGFKLTWDKPREWSFWINMIQLMADAALEEAPDTEDDLKRYAVNQIFERLPTPGGPLLSTAETAINYDFFRDMPIEGYTDQSVHPDARWDHRTSLISKAVGQALGKVTRGLPAPFQVSPKKVQHISEGTFGAYRDYLKWPTTPKKDLKARILSAPIFKAFAGEYKYSQSVTDFYNAAAKRAIDFKSDRRLADLEGREKPDEPDQVKIDRLAKAMLTGISMAEIADGGIGVRTYEYEKYRVGLARMVEGKKPLSNSPNPLAVPREELPEKIQQLVTEFRKPLELPEWNPRTGRYKGEPDPNSKTAKTPYAERYANWRKQVGFKKKVLDQIKAERELRKGFKKDGNAR